MFLPAALATLVAVSQAAAPEVLLEEAKRAYVEGDPERASYLFRKLLAEGPLLPAHVRREALAYLGDLLYSEEGPEAATNVFETLLAEDPGYTLDAFDHPPEVCAYFESLRTVKPPEAALPSPGAAKWPALVAVPGGVYYYTVGKPGTAVLLGLAQVGGAVGSELTFLRLREMSACLNDTPPTCDEIDREEEVDAYIRLRAVNAGLVLAGTAAYLGPLVVETARWGRETTVSVGVGPGGMVVAGRFLGRARPGAPPGG